MRTIMVVLLMVCVALAAGCEPKEPAQPKPAEKPKPAQKPAEGKAEMLKAARESLEKGLGFLFANQKVDGSIINDQPGAEQAALGATGLAVNGASRAPKDIRARYEEKIALACKYILIKQMTDGSFQGGEGLPTYTTAIAIMALHNADAKKYAEYVKQGQEYLIKAQYYSEVKPEDLNYGGWTYGHDAKGEGKQANMSTSHYALMGLHETGLDKTHEVWKRALVYVGRCQDNSETSDVKGIKFTNDSGFRYGPKTTRGSKDKKGLIDEKTGMEYYPSYASMTYAGFKSLLYANLPKDDPRVLGALSWMKNNYTLDKNTGMGYRKNEKKEMEQQGMYYFYNAFARAMDAWGEKEFEDISGAKHNWATELCKKLMEKQADDGSWVNLQDRWHESMKSVVTGYSIDALCTCIPWLEK